MKHVIYTRVSSKDQADKYSLPAQEKLLKECIAREGGELVGIYTDAGISGETIEARPEFSRLLIDAQEKRFDAVWVVDQDRLSRGDMGTLALIKKTFRDNSIIICTPSHKLSLDDIDSELMSNIFGAFSQFERQKFIQRANRGRQFKAEKGEWGGRVSPYGYSFDITKDKHLVINKEEAVIYRLIVNLFLDSGLGVKRIANELNRLGHKNRGKPWRMQSINYMLKSATYKGTLVHQKFKSNGYTKDKKKKRWYNSKICIEIPNAHPAIISDETFEIIQARLKDNRSKHKTFMALQLLTNLLECPLCHNSFKVGSTGFGKYRRWVYRCKTRYAYWSDKSKPKCSMRTFPVDEYNEKIWKAFQEIAKRPDLIEKALKESRTPDLTNLELYQTEFNHVVRKLEEFNTCKEKAVSLYIKGIISEEDLNSQILKLTEERKTLEQRKKELQVKIDYQRRIASEGIRKETILKYAKFIYQSDKKLNIQQKRRVLEAFVVRIPIYSNGEFEIVYRFPIEDIHNYDEFQLTTEVQAYGGAQR